MADRPDHDLADRPTEVLAELLHHRATQNAIVRSYGIMPSSRPEDDDLDRAAAARLRQLTDETPFVTKYVRVPDERDELRRQLDTLRNALLDAIGDPDELRRVAVSVARDRKVTSAEAERRIGLLTRIAAAVGDPEPTNPDEPHPDADFIEVDYWCHFDDKGRAVRVHDASTVHMDGCTRMYVRAVGDPEEGRA